MIEGDGGETILVFSQSVYPRGDTLAYPGSKLTGVIESPGAKHDGRRMSTGTQMRNERSEERNEKVMWRSGTEPL